MSAAANPDIVTDGLVFKYDTGDGKSYRGEPTENLITQMAGSTTISYPQTVYISTASETNVSDSSAPGGQYSRFTGNTNDNNNQLYSTFNGANIDVRNTTITYSVYLKGSGTCHLTIYADNAGYGTSSTITLTDEWTRYTYTRAVTNYTTNCWVAVRGLLTTTDVYIAAQQAEIKTHATPFVNGTRSDTQGLLDRTGNSTIDLSDVSFDSNAQMVFDGTDDHIELTSNGFGEFNFQTWTVESWVKFDTITGDRVIFSYDYTSHSQPYYSTHLRTNGVGKLFLMWNDGTQYRSLSTSSNAVSSGEWYHLVGVYESGRQQIFLNGESLVSSTRTDTITFYNQEVWIGRANYAAYHDGDIKVLRHYNKALTAKEVLQNYNATKSRFGL